MNQDSISASVVYAGIGVPSLPPSSSEPRSDQMIGTPAEVLIEIAGRTCYDSIGTGRSSKDFHAHLKDVRHFSVHEHARANFVIEFDNESEVWRAMSMLCNIRDARAFPIPGKPLGLAVSLNLRHILEWDEITDWTKYSDAYLGLERLSRSMGYLVRKVGNSIAPVIIPEPEAPEFPLYAEMQVRPVHDYYIPLSMCRDFRDDVLVPRTTHVSMYLFGSRLFSHEQVRHRFAVSQRSTRYVDEAGAGVALHPVATKCILEPRLAEVVSHISNGRILYSGLVADIEDGLSAVDGLTGTDRRKIARGASRMVLESSLPTEMIFTASISDWKCMLNQRCKDWADAEIRLVYNRALEALVSHPHTRRYFEKAEVKRAKDGCGFVLNKDLI